MLNRLFPCCLGETCDCHPPAFNGGYLSAKRPREPSDINWRNYGATGRPFRMLFALILTAVTCTGYYFVVTIARDYSDAGGGVSTQLGIGIGVALSALNFVYEFLFLNVTLLEKHKSKSGMQTSMIWKKLALEILNNLVIMLLVFNIPGGNDYTDVAGQADRAKWYNSAGVLLTSLMISDTFLPCIVRVIHPIHRLKKFIISCCCAHDQEKLNQAYVPQLSIYNNFIAFLATLTWVFIYSPAIPVAIPLSLLKLVFLYWIEKYNVLRRYGKPDMIDDRAAAFLVAIVPLGLIVQCVAALVCFRYFTSVYTLFNIDSIPTSTSEANTTSGQIVMVPMLGLAVLVFLLGDVVGRFLGAVGCKACRAGQRASRYDSTCCWDMRKVVNTREEIPYVNVAGIESYMHPDQVQEVFAPTSEFAAFADQLAPSTMKALSSLSKG